MDNQVIFGGQTNMQNNMRTIHVGIFHLFQKPKKKNKNMLGIKTLILLHLTTETLLLSQTRLSKNRKIANFYFISHFSDQRRLRHFRKFDLALKFEKSKFPYFFSFDASSEITGETACALA